MATSERGFIDRLVNEEIKRLVAGAIGDGSTLSARLCARQILKTYRGSGLREREVANRVMMAAAQAGIPVEIGTPAGGPWEAGTKPGM